MTTKTAFQAALLSTALILAAGCSSSSGEDRCRSNADCGNCMVCTRDGCRSKICSDGIYCTVDVCEASTGECEFIPSDDRCALNPCDRERGCRCASDMDCEDFETCSADGYCHCESDCQGRCCGASSCGGECPDNCHLTGQSCDYDSCECTGTCIPLTCEDLGKECGQWDDGCGGNLDCGLCAIPVEWVFTEDGTKPCLGAGHMEFEINYQDDTVHEHIFGQIFNGETHACAIPGFTNIELRADEQEIVISVSLWDSTSETSGQLSTGTSAPFSTVQGMESIEVSVEFSRTQAPLGTIIVPEPPPDWGELSGIDTLTYRVTAVEADQVLRSGNFSFSPEWNSHPFPLLISSLELFDQSTELQLVVEALRGQDVVRSWTAAAYLGGAAPNPAYAQLP